jgi:hypothetical protein
MEICQLMNQEAQTRSETTNTQGSQEAQTQTRRRRTKETQKAQGSQEALTQTMWYQTTLRQETQDPGPNTGTRETNLSTCQVSRKHQDPLKELRQDTR